MEDPLATAPPPRRPHRERRHRRKASDAAAAALAAQAASSYGDVFGGPPRFAPPPAAGAGTAPADYAEVFGGVAASCSIPYLDLPPAVASGVGAGGYGEIFGRFDFGDFAVPYEDMLSGAESLVEEIASPSGSSRSSTRKESVRLDAEPSVPYQQVPDAGSGRHSDDEQFHAVSFPPDGEQTFTMSYNKITRGRPDDLVEMTACIVEPSISYVVDSCNLSNDLEMDYVPVMDSGTNANVVKEKMNLPNIADSGLECAESAYVVDHQQQIPTCPPISENICQDENYNKRSSTHSVSSEEAPSPDYPFLRVSNINLPAAPIKVQPPPMPPSKLLNKKGSNENGDSDVNPNSVAAAAAMKEAMQFAEARLKAAKELMEIKGVSSKFRKRPVHHKSTKSTEIKEYNAPEKAHLFEEKLDMRRLVKEENQSNDIALLDKNTGSVALEHSDHDKKGIISPGKPKEMMENDSELEQLGEWTSDADFYELVSNDQKCRTNGAECRDNGLMTNSLAKLDRSENEKLGGFAGESKRSRKLWDCNNRTCLRTEHVNQGKDGIGSLEVEQKNTRSPEVTEHVNQQKDAIDSVETEQKTPRSPEVSPCNERVTYEEPTKGNIDLMTNSSTKLDQSVKVKEGVFAGEPKRFRKLWGSNSTAVLRTVHVNQEKDAIAFVEAEEKAPRFSEVPPCDERVASQEATDSRLEQCPGVGNSLGHENGAQFETSCVNNLPSEVHADPEISSSFSERCSSGSHANGNENHSESTAQETAFVGNSSQNVNNKEELELPCIDGLPCTSARNQILQEHFNVINADENKEIEVKISKLEGSSKSYLNFEEEKLPSFVDESCLQNKNERENEVNSESPIHEKMTKFGFEDKGDAYEDFQEGDMDQVAGSAEEEGYVTSGSGIANESEYEEAEDDIFVGDMESNVRTWGSFDKDPYQRQESQGSWGPQDLDNRMDKISDTISHGKERETKESLLENVEKTAAEEVLNHDCREGQKSMETVDYIWPKYVCAEFNVSSDKDGNVFDSADELISDNGSDYAMNMSTMSNNLQASFSEACSSIQHLSQKPQSISAEKADESTPVLGNLEVDCGEAGRKIPSENCEVSEEGQNIGIEMEERKREDNISNIRFMDQQPFYLDSDIRPKAAEGTASETILKSREEDLNVQRTKVRNDIKEAEGELEKEVKVVEEKEKECKMGKEKEQDKERQRRELEEQKEREMERAKDRLAVQRATREAHERAFAEVRAKAERIALERITSARQRASAEAHEKEEKATAQAALEQASREARMKAERAAVERATAEARERAIEKAKAAADAKERIGKFRSSFKDSFKAPNQDNQHEASSQKTAYNKHGKSMDSCVEVVEVESALRHKAKLERHQRTAERAAKALAEKNMRDMLVQREHAEKHRLAEFLDPEVKRWSNGKEGNLRALLSTLQYILGSDSGWQAVPLTDLITAAGVKKAYRKATLCVHPDKVQQRGATIRQKYICEKVFDLLKEAWNKYNSEER